MISELSSYDRADLEIERCLNSVVMDLERVLSSITEKHSLEFVKVMMSRAFAMEARSIVVVPQIRSDIIRRAIIEVVQGRRCATQRSRPSKSVVRGGEERVDAPGCWRRALLAA